MRQDRFINDENVLSLKLNDFVCVFFSLGEKLIQVVDSNILCHISTSLKQTTDKLFFKKMQLTVQQ